jgi:hypothetical protein
MNLALELDGNREHLVRGDGHRDEHSAGTLSRTADRDAPHAGTRIGRMTFEAREQDVPL